MIGISIQGPTVGWSGATNETIGISIVGVLVALCLVEVEFVPMVILIL